MESELDHRSPLEALEWFIQVEVENDVQSETVDVIFPAFTFLVPRFASSSEVEAVLHLVEKYNFIVTPEDVARMANSSPDELLAFATAPSYEMYGTRVDDAVYALDSAGFDEEGDRYDARCIILLECVAETLASLPDTEQIMPERVKVRDTILEIRARSEGPF